MTRTKMVIAVATMATLTAGCGGSTDQGDGSGKPSTVSPSDMSNDQAAPTRLVIDVTIKDGNVTPTNAQLEAARNEPIVVRINSDTTDQLHVHSNPEHTFNIEAKPMQSFQFTVDVPGKVDVELHHLNRSIATIAVQ